MNGLMELLPRFYEASEGVNEIQNGLSIEVSALQKAQEDLFNQIFIDTATWSLDSWDKFLGVYTKGFEVEDRRKILKSKLLSQPNFTKDKVINILKSLVDDANIIEDNPNYTFDMYLMTRSNFNEKINTVIKQIEGIKPAHLDYRVVAGYITSVFIIDGYKFWQSSLIPLCGTIDVSYNEIIITEGKVCSSYISNTVNKYNSEIIPTTSENRYIQLTDGKYSFETVKSNKVSYQSEVIGICSEYYYCKGGDDK